MTIVILDQLTKAILVANLDPGQIVSVVGDYIRLVFSQNSGALFGLFRDQAILFAIASLVVIGLIVAFHGQSERSLYLSIALGLLLGGAIGNMIDRLRLGYVVDFVDIGIGGFRWYTFNVADAAISTALVMLFAVAFIPRLCQARGATDPRNRRTPESVERVEGERVVDPSAVAGVRVLRVPEGSAGRVDRYVADATGLSRSYVQKLISDGRLTADGMPIRANTIVGTGAELRLDVPAPVALDVAPDRDIKLAVVYEDADLLIIDKPAGLVVHPAPGHSDGTLVNALLAHGDGDTWGGIAGVQRPGIVHRLDRDTSGLLMVARHDAAQASLMAQLKARRIKKTYQALVQGSVAAAVGRIEAPIGRDPKHRTRMARGPRRSAVRHRIPRPRAVRWLDAPRARPRHRADPPDPGPSRCDRSPVAGDPVYGTGTSRRGPDGLERLFLHAWRLELTSPSDGHLIRATAPLPPELESVLDALREVPR